MLVLSNVGTAAPSGSLDSYLGDPGSNPGSGKPTHPTPGRRRGTLDWGSKIPHGQQLNRQHGDSSLCGQSPMDF